MAGLKPSVNLFALLDRSDPGEKRLADFDAANARSTAAPAAASLAQEPTARDHVIRQNQKEKQAKAAKKRAAARAKSAGASTDSSACKISKADDGAKRGGYKYNNGGQSRKQQSGTSGGYNNKTYYNNNGGSKRQQPGMAENKVRGEGVRVPPAEKKVPEVLAPPPVPPSIDDIDEFPSLK